MPVGTLSVPAGILYDVLFYGWKAYNKSVNSAKCQNKFEITSILCHKSYLKTCANMV